MSREPLEAAVPTRTCGLCGVPLATGSCSHVAFFGEQVVMTKAAWWRMVDELNRLRNLAGDQDE